MDPAYAASLSDPSRNRRFRGPWSDPPANRRRPRPGGARGEPLVADQVVQRALHAAARRAAILDQRTAALLTIGLIDAALRFAAIADGIRREVLA
jgi:hypothetical protein